MALQVAGVRPGVSGALRFRNRRIVSERRVVEEGVGDVQPEAVDAEGQPAALA
jgi:hypothetical protein